MHQAGLTSPGQLQLPQSVLGLCQGGFGVEAESLVRHHHRVPGNLWWVDVGGAEKVTLGLMEEKLRPSFGTWFSGLSREQGGPHPEQNHLPIGSWWAHELVLRVHISRGSFFSERGCL